MRFRRLVLGVFSLIYFSFLPGAAWPAAVPQTAKLDSKAVRAQLSSYFRDIARNSPTVLGELASSPETMAAIQERIAAMSDEELAKFAALMADAPDWKVAPEAFATALPPELVNQVRRAGNDSIARLPKGEAMRDDVRTLVAVLKVLPDAKLRDLGIDRKMVDSLETTFTELPALQAAMLQQRANEASSWNEQSARAIDALPPALQRGAAALAEHGPLTEKDMNELEEFRNELVALLERIDELPPEMREKLDVDLFRNQLDGLRTAQPDVLFMLRHNITPEMLEGLRKNVAFLRRISRFTDDEKTELESFRGDLARALESASPDGTHAELDALIAGLKPAELFLLQQRMMSFGAWQVAFPATYQTLAQPETQERIRAVQGPTPDPVAVRSLEGFRSEAIAYVDSLRGTEGIDPQLIARARQTLESAALDRLEIIRSTASSMGASATPIQLLGIVAMHEINWNCSLTFTAIPAGCVDPCFGIAGGCEVCTPALNVTASFDSICNPLEDAIEAVEHSIVGAANTVVSAMQTAINTAITTVQNTINSTITSVQNVINSTIAAITSTINSVWTFLQTVPGLAWNALKTALDLLLDIEIRNGVTIRSLVAQGAESAMTSMKTLLGLTEGWWTQVAGFTLPAIPCPPSGFHTPFGNVGDDAAANNYGRYKLVIDGIIEMIPDTEISLKIKIPAQLLYMAFDFFGLCLEQAAAAADDALAAERHDLVIANFTTVQNYIGTEFAALTVQTGNQTDELMELIEAQSASLQGTIATQSAAIQSLLNSESSAIQTLLADESDSIQLLLRNETDTTQDAVEAFRDLNLRLTIERVLRGGVGGEVGHLQLRAPWGHLQLVARIVRESIDAMRAAQETIGEAEKFYAEGIRLMELGKDKEAFVQLAMAYRDAAK